MIIRGTTPYHSFILPMSVADIQEIYITYLQNDSVVLDKTGTDITLVDNNDDLENASVESLDENEVEVSCTATVHLSQEDTLAFHFYPAAEKNIAVVQIRILDVDGEAYSSDPMRERIFGVIHDGVIGGNNETV